MFTTSSTTSKGVNLNHSLSSLVTARVLMWRSLTWFNICYFLFMTWTTPVTRNLFWCLVTGQEWRHLVVFLYNPDPSLIIISNIDRNCSFLSLFVCLHNRLIADCKFIITEDTTSFHCKNNFGNSFSPKSLGMENWWVRFDRLKNNLKRIECKMNEKNLL